MPELFTWTVLVTAAGTIALATAVAALVKALCKPTTLVLRYVVLGVCVLVQGAAAGLSGPQTPETYIVAAANSAVLALAAMGIYEKARHGLSARVVGKTKD